MTDPNPTQQHRVLAPRLAPGIKPNADRHAVAPGARCGHHGHELVGGWCWDCFPEYFLPKPALDLSTLDLQEVEALLGAAEARREELLARAREPRRFQVRYQGTAPLDCPAATWETLRQPQVLSFQVLDGRPRLVSRQTLGTREPSEPIPVAEGTVHLLYGSAVQGGDGVLLGAFSTPELADQHARKAPGDWGWAEAWVETWVIDMITRDMEGFVGSTREKAPR